MEKLRNTLNKVLNLLAGLSMTVMVVLTTYQVIVRYIFNSPSTWSEVLVGYLFGWSTMLGATIVSGERQGRPPPCPGHCGSLQARLLL